MTETVQTHAIIPARSEREAMDWSLVLASQGLQATIVGAATDHGWRLIVHREDYRPALQAIRQFRLENRARSWPKPVARTGLLFDVRAVPWMFVFLVLFVAEQTVAPSLPSAGWMTSEALSQGQWWRLFTAVSLHADAGHLALNLASGVLLLGLAMGSYGFGWSALAAYASGAAGNLATAWFLPAPHVSLGASGMVMGALGLLTMASIKERSEGLPRAGLAWRGAIGGVLLLVLLGFNPQSNVIAHVGGFIGGVFLGMFMSHLPARWRMNTRANHLAELICAILMMWTWYLALTAR